jgi:uncharacterized protein YnzC (UPF0291/DUF896 family)
MKSIILVLLLAGCVKSLTYEEAKEQEKYCESHGMRIEYTNVRNSKEVYSIMCIDPNGNKYSPKAHK